MDSFWNKLPKPFFVLAPMADVTDPAYRRLISETKNPDVMWTEFVSADGLYATREKKKMPDVENPLLRDFQFSESERPVVAQIFSSKPEMIAYASKLAAELGFDGVDLNMGCPDKSIEKQGAGAAMIKTPELAKEIIAAARTSGLPVSVKTRIGYNAVNLEEWLTAILEEKPAALTVHLRTRKEMSKVDAHWELMGNAVEIRNRVSPDTLIIGNGDVQSIEDGKKKIVDSGADGVMLGRAIFGNPWLFAGRASESLSKEERLAALAQLARYFSELRPAKSYHLLKKHFKAFVSGFDGAAELRGKLMETNSYQEFLVLSNSKEYSSV
ncbi:MAG: tRNA-dihydrouridine synthase B [Parcubacteria bacterium C7867-001]|nr:MAG: tRNA-dihydrouridine synthase B [Parcubacteria bacterium C7867-001]